jgi:flagellar secretion chaperone FliS
MSGGVNYGSASYGQASDHYRSMDISSRVAVADPHALVSILYDELLTCVDVLAAAAGRGQLLSGQTHAHRARAILISLQSGLDFGQGGELAPMLAGLYGAISEELNDRIADSNIDRLGELRSAIESVAHAWNDIAG